MKIEIQKFCVIVLALISTAGFSQRKFPFKPSGIGIQLVSQSGTLNTITGQKVIAKSRFGSLLSEPNDSYEINGAISNQSLQLTIHFAPIDSTKRFEWQFSFANEVVNASWGEWTQDTVLHKLSGKYENFRLGTGYNYFIKQGNIFQASIGTTFDLVFPVSAVSKEDVSYPTLEEEQIKLFGHKATSIRWGIPVNLLLRLFGSTHFKFGLRPGVNHYQLDGISKYKWVNGFEIGLKFYLL